MSVTDKGMFFLFSAESIDATSEFLEVILSSDAFNVTIISFTLWCFILHVQWWCLEEEDFDPNVPSIVILDNETRKCANVTIIDDQIVERMEAFEVAITFPPGQPALQIGEIVPPAMQLNGTINIIDDDGEHIGNRIIHII